MRERVRKAFSYGKTELLVSWAEPYVEKCADPIALSFVLDLRGF